MLQSTPVAPLPITGTLGGTKLAALTGVFVGDGLGPLVDFVGLPVPMGDGRCAGVGEILPTDVSARPGGNSGRWYAADGRPRTDESGGVSVRLGSPKGVCRPSSLRGNGR